MGEPKKLPPLPTCTGPATREERYWMVMHLDELEPGGHCERWEATVRELVSELQGLLARPDRRARAEHLLRTLGEEVPERDGECIECEDYFPASELFDGMLCDGCCEERGIARIVGPTRVRRQGES